MGGTFPLMVHLLKVRRVDVGRAAGRAYAINTLGAAVGTLALPAILLPSLGIAASLALAAVSNFAAAALAFAFSKTAPVRSAHVDPSAEMGDPLSPGLAPGSSPSGGIPSVPEVTVPIVRDEDEPARDLSPSTALLVAFFLSSFASLSLEAVWTRHLGFFFGAQTFTFAFVLFAYLLGLFLGGGAYARWKAYGGDPGFILRAGLLAAGIGVAVPLPFLDYLAIPQIEMMLRLGISNSSFLVTCGLVTIALILVPALGFGLIFPAVVDILSREGRLLGSSVGVTYVVNTLGTTLGALAAGFLLVPWLGSQRTLEICVLMIAGAYVLARWAAAGALANRSWRRYAVPAALCLVVIFPRWDWRFAHAQYSKDPLTFLDKYVNGSLWPTIAPYKISYLVEGTEATVSVCEFGGNLRSLYVNGKPDASNIPDDMVAQRLLACIPGLFHPAPKTALVIGVGSGTTVATLKRFSLTSIDAAEISPEVSDAARRFFSDVNDLFLSDRRISLHLDDGRNFLHFRPPDTYDIIISEPSNPWMAGVSALFTDEFFADVKEKLRPGGIFCQWFHYYNMSMDHIRLLARTFRKHFPETAMFALRGGRPTGDIVIIGSKGPLRMVHLPEDPALPESVRAALAEVGNAGSQQIASGLVTTPGDFDAFVRTGPLNTDDRPILEFEAPADRFVYAFYETMGALITSSERTFLPAGPGPEDSTAAVEIAKDGLSTSDGPPEGQEVRRGLTVLTRFRTGSQEDISRWVLIGREFDSGASTIGLFRLARTLARPDEHVEIATALAGTGMSSRNEITINGHVGLWVVAESEGKRTVAVGWNCPQQDRAFFLTRSLPVSSAPPPDQIAAALAAHYVCLHRDR